MLRDVVGTRCSWTMVNTSSIHGPGLLAWRYNCILFYKCMGLCLCLPQPAGNDCASSNEIHMAVRSLAGFIAQLFEANC